MKELDKRSSHYDGVEVCTAIPISMDQLAATLPPKGIVTSVPVLELCTGAVRAALACAADSRLPDEEVETPRPRASLSFAPGEEAFPPVLRRGGAAGFRGGR